MIYGYARVSTKKQIKGFSIEDQTNQLLEHGCQEVIPEQYTGKTMNRPEFDKLLEQLQKGDTLMVCKIDRLARNLSEGIDVLQELVARGIIVHILNLGIVDDSVNGRLVINILLSIAQWERETILERTSAGKRIAKQKPGYREGRRPIAKEKVDLAMELLDSKKHTYKAVRDMTGISIASLVRYRQKRKAVE